MEKYCPNCNRPNSSDAAFCRHCATPLGSEPSQGRQTGYQQTPGSGYQQWNQPQNFGQMQQQYPNQQRKSEFPKGMVSVILVAVGLLLCCGPFTGIPAAILGWMEMTAIKEGRSLPENMWMAQVGLWGGIVVSVLGVIAMFFMLLLSAASGPGY